jgi:23S rRNA (cytosine1962-C5)-methyltransferase
VAENHRSFCQDAFDFFSLAQERYELIVLDPPAFAKHREAIPQALKGYRGINRSALRNIAPGGLLFTFSCSQLISPELFRETLFSAAAQAGREVRILRELHQGPDHPINLFHPEGSYLKGLLLQVE